MAEAAAEALAVAKASLKDTCNALISRESFFPTFNESLNSADYLRWRRDLEQFVSSAGDDFLAALKFPGTIPAAVDYDVALVTSDLPTSIQTLTMPQMRQRALLSVIRSTLPSSGESLRLIRHCTHAAGVIHGGGTLIDQALIVLDKRWSGAARPEFDVGKESKALQTMTWPVDFSVDAYNSYVNLAVTRAGRIGQAPLGDDDDSKLLRAAWWHVIAKPPSTSPYYAPAQEARTVTGQACSTVAHREAWRVAMCEAIGVAVDAGVGAPKGGLARGVMARYGGTARRSRRGW